MGKKGGGKNKQAPPQKKNLVPATLRPEQLESGVSDRNIKLQLPISFLSKDREPGSKAGQKVRRAASTILQPPVAFPLTPCVIAVTPRVATVDPHG